MGKLSPRNHPGNDPMPEGLPDKLKRGLDEEWERQQEEVNSGDDE